MEVTDRQQNQLHLGRILINDLHQILASLEERLGGGVRFEVRLEEKHNSTFLSTDRHGGSDCSSSVT